VALLLPMFALADGGNYGGVGVNIGLFMFIVGLICLFVGFIMLFPQRSRKSGGYTMLTGLLLLLVGFGVCTASM